MDRIAFMSRDHTLAPRRTSVEDTGEIVRLRNPPHLRLPSHLLEVEGSRAGLLTAAVPMWRFALSNLTPTASLSKSAGQPVSSPICSGNMPPIPPRRSVGGFALRIAVTCAKKGLNSRGELPWSARAAVAALRRSAMKPRLLGLLFAGMFLIPSGALAQQSASSGLVGLVTDSSQGAIPGATVTVTNVGTNAQRRRDRRRRTVFRSRASARDLSHQSRAAGLPDGGAVEFRPAPGRDGAADDDARARQPSRKRSP